VKFTQLQCKFSQTWCSVGELFYRADATGLRIDLAAVREKDERSDKNSEHA